MTTLEQRLCSTPGRAKEVRAIFEATFSTEAGRQCLELLVEGAHPMTPRSLSDKPEFLDGEATTIGFIWRFGSQLAALPEPKTKTENE